SHLSYYDPHLDLHSFPTRRSSDLPRDRRKSWTASPRPAVSTLPVFSSTTLNCGAPLGRADVGASAPLYSIATGLPFRSRWTVSRSEEHTSELQSLRHLVCRLLLEK